MALVRGFERRDLERNTIHVETDCTYTSFVGPDGRKYFQLGTYGSPTRKRKGSMSQVIQFDEAAAQALMEILRDEFLRAPTREPQSISADLSRPHRPG